MLQISRMAVQGRTLEIISSDQMVLCKRKRTGNWSESLKIKDYDTLGTKRTCNFPWMCRFQLSTLCRINSFSPAQYGWALNRQGQYSYLTGKPTELRDLCAHFTKELALRSAPTGKCPGAIESLHGIDSQSLGHLIGTHLSWASHAL